MPGNDELVESNSFGQELSKEDQISSLRRTIIESGSPISLQMKGKSPEERAKIFDSAVNEYAELIDVPEGEVRTYYTLDYKVHGPAIGKGLHYKQVYGSGDEAMEQYQKDMDERNRLRRKITEAERLAKEPNSPRSQN